MRVINVALRGAPPFVVLYLDIDDIKDDLLLKEVGGAPQGCRGARRITGLEALIRWNHKTRNLLTPPAFIPIAERIGTAHPLGNWVLGESCRQLKLWHMEGIAPDVRRSVQGQLRAGARGGCKPVALGH
ncbi:MAG: EAL domain-containing protein [Methyloceanibacter sp.]